MSGVWYPFYCWNLKLLPGRQEKLGAISIPRNPLEQNALSYGHNEVFSRSGKGFIDKIRTIMKRAWLLMTGRDWSRMVTGGSKMEAVRIDIPEDIVLSLKMPAKTMKQALTIELAIQLYQRELLSFAKARALARISRWAFAEVLGDRKIPRHFNDADLDEDLEFAAKN